MDRSKKLKNDADAPSQRSEEMLWMFKYSYVYFTWGLEKQYDPIGKPEEILEVLKTHGYDGVEVPGEPDKIDAKKLKELLDSYELKAAGVTGLWGWAGRAHGDPTNPDERMRKTAVDYCRKCLEMMTVLEAEVVNLAPCPPVHLEAPAKQLSENFVRTARETDKLAGEYGFGVPIEPVNRIEGYYGVVNTLSEARAIIEGHGLENTEIFADLFHMNIEEKSMIGAFLENGKHVVHIHCVDSNRKAPGMGLIDFKSIFEVLKFLRYDKYLSVEVIPPRPDPKILAENAINYMKTLQALI